MKIHRYPARRIALSALSALSKAAANMYLYLNLLRPAAGLFQAKIGWTVVCECRELTAAPQVGLLLAS
jgi:hypothetical protein